MIIPYPIDDLFALAEQMGVNVVWYPHETCPRGRYRQTQDNIRLVFLNPALRHSEMRLRCSLAHELGHAANGAGGEIIGGELRDEARARRWARKLLMPDEWMESRLNLPAYEIAEAAGVYDLWAQARLRDFARLLVSHSA